MRKTAPHFPKGIAERANKRHTDRPRKFDILDILADHLPVGQVKALQSLPGRVPFRYQSGRSAGIRLTRWIIDHCIFIGTSCQMIEEVSLFVEKTRNGILSTVRIRGEQGSAGALKHLAGLDVLLT